MLFDQGSKERKEKMYGY